MSMLVLLYWIVCGALQKSFGVLSPVRFVVGARVQSMRSTAGSTPIEVHVHGAQASARLLLPPLAHSSPALSALAAVLR